MASSAFKLARTRTSCGAGAKPGPAHARRDAASESTVLQAGFTYRQMFYGKRAEHPRCSRRTRMFPGGSGHSIMNARDRATGRTAHAECADTPLRGAGYAFIATPRLRLGPPAFA